MTKGERLYKKIKLSELSLVLTNLKILKEAKNNKHSQFAILEDDIEIFSDSINDLNTLYYKAKKYNPDLLYLEFANQHTFLKNEIEPNIYKLKHPICTAFIIYSLEGANKVLNLVNKKYSINEEEYVPNIPLDMFYAKNTFWGHINSYGIPIFKQARYKFKTNLQNNKNMDKYFIKP